MVESPGRLKKIFGVLIICVIPVFTALGGCVFLEHREQINALKGLDKNGRDITNYLDSEREGFSRLKEDFRNNRLKKNADKSEIRSAYGEPVLCENKNNDKRAEESCLYRDPTEFLNTDEIYLYFDRNGRLKSWDFFAAGD